MYLLSWHGTVLRVEDGTGQMIHALPWPARAHAQDWALDIDDTARRAPAASAIDPALRSVPAGKPGMVQILRGEAYLSADLATGLAQFTQQAPGNAELFLLLGAADLAELRRLLGTSWRGAQGAAVTARLHSGFVLSANGCDFDLTAGIPDLPRGAGVSAAGPRLDARDHALAPRAAENAPAFARSGDAFRAQAEARLAITGAPALLALPLAASPADDAWMLRARGGAGPSLGPRAGRIVAQRERQKYMLDRPGHGLVIFDETGSATDPGGAAQLPLTATGDLRREGGRIFVADAALGSAPFLAGPHVVLPGLDPAGYYLWLLRALLPLAALRPYVPPETKILLPPGLDRARAASAALPDYRGLLAAWGFGAMPALEMPQQLVQLEEAFWIEPCAIEDYPAELLQAAGGALRPAAPGGPRRNIYIKRRNDSAVEAPAAIEQALRNNDFEIHVLEDLSPAAQVALYAGAASIAAPHGAGLAGIIYCAPGTRVIEFSPEEDFLANYAVLSSKLGLIHGVVPCPTKDGRFSSPMRVNPAKFRAVLRQMQVMSA